MNLRLWFILVALPLQAATYHVRTNGNDSADGLSWANAWLTLTKAATTITHGDTVYAGQGDYNEYVQVTVRNSKWITESNAITRAFRFDAGTNWLQGWRTKWASDAGFRTWGANVYVNSDAHFTTITNCWIGDQPYVTATNFVCNSPSGATNRITSTSVDFLAAGFAEGSKVNVNGVSYSNTTRGAQFRFVNQHAKGFVTNVTATAITFTNNLLPETNLSTWAFIAAGDTVDAIYGVRFIASGGAGPSNCVVTSCTFSNMTGQPITMTGHDNTVTNCEFVKILGNSFITYSGYSLYFFSNYFHDCPLPAYYSSTEVVDHTGGSFYDYYVRTVIGGTSQTWNTNIWFKGNWMEDVEGASLSINHATDSDPGDFRTLVCDGNVFIGIAGELDGGMDDMYFMSNTFYRCSFQEGHSAAVTIGGLTGTYTNTGLVHTHNLYVANGDHRSHTNEGYPSFEATVNIISSNNFVCGPEVSRWNPMPSWPATNGVNGGDPLFVNEFNPRGPDGRPFTEDDGLRLHPRSPALGIGALPVAVATAARPYAVFRPVNVASNYLDYRFTNFNINWHTGLYAFERTTWDRVWDYGDALLNLPQTVTLSATNSISGGWSTNDWVGIKWFVWSFGDGSFSVRTPANCPEVTHTFLTTGQVTVTLTVTNWEGNSSTHSRNYRILPGTNFANDVFYVSTTGSDAAAGTYAAPWATVTNAVAQAGVGDYVAVLPGSYPKDIDLADHDASNGTANAWITFVGYSAHVPKLWQKRNYWAWEGFGLSPTNSNVALFNNVTGFVLRNWWIHDGGQNIDPIKSELQYGSSTNITIQNCYITEVWPIDGVIIGHWVDTTIDGNICERNRGEGDFFRDSGHNVTVKRNYLERMSYANSDHPDFVANNNTDPFSNWTIEKNWLHEPDSTNVYSLGNMGTGGGVATNVVFRNNVFIGVFNGHNPLGGNGARMHNNLYYHVFLTGNGAFVTGGSAGALTNIDCRNNAYVECGTGSTGNGWYGNQIGTPGQDSATNSTFSFANYNFVCGTNGVGKDSGGVNQAFKWGTLRDYNGISIQMEVNGINGGNPRFVNAPAYDFRLVTNSPLVAVGADLSAFFTDDYFGKTRSAWDIGPIAGSFAALPGVSSISLSGELRISGGVTLR